MYRMHAWMKRRAGALLLALACCPLAQAYDSNAAMESFIAARVRDDGMDEAWLRALFAGAQRQQAILDAIARPAERTRPWHEYRAIFLTDERLRQGLEFWQLHAATLARAEQQYGVPAEIIVAIIGVETFYGRNTGKWKVIDGLSTLAFDYPPRAPFFQDQLRELLLLCREQGVDPLALTGSYAGAMGLPQFMPGSFRKWAVDFDGDGQINIWNNPVDAIGSVASYFRAHGWVKGDPVASRATLASPEAASAVTAELEANSTVAKLLRRGWQPAEPLPDALAVTAFRLEGDAGNEFWMGLPNFYVITRYNHSAMYAMAVYQLSQSLQANRPDR